MLNVKVMVFPQITLNSQVMVMYGEFKIGNLAALSLLMLLKLLNDNCTVVPDSSIMCIT